MRREPAAGPKVVAIGGGHGLAASLRAARTYAGELTAIVSVADDGGSSGRLRRQFAIPAPGDLRRCLVAVAEPNSPWAVAFEYRFPQEAGGDLAGHALGNLIIAALAAVTGEFGEALRLAAGLLNADARVLPATLEAVDLAGTLEGVEVRGQVRIQEAEGEVRDLHILPPDAPAPAAVREAIAGADQIVIGPGSLFTSVLAACVIPDIASALAARAGGRIYVCNLHPEVPETAGYRPADHVRVLAEHGITVDTVLCDCRWWDRDEEQDEPAGGGAHHAGHGPNHAGQSLPASPAVVHRRLATDPHAGHDAALLAAALRSLL